jgi:hypothetical protein
MVVVGYELGDEKSHGRAEQEGSEQLESLLLGRRLASLLGPQCANVGRHRRVQVSVVEHLEQRESAGPPGGRGFTKSDNDCTKSMPYFHGAIGH